MFFAKWISTKVTKTFILPPRSLQGIVCMKVLRTFRPVCVCLDVCVSLECPCLSSEVPHILRRPLMWKTLSHVRLFATPWTLWDAMVCMYSPWNSPGQNPGVGSLSLLQGIFPTQGLNCSVLRRQILYHWATWEDSCSTWNCNFSLSVREGELRIFILCYLDRDSGRNLLLNFSKPILIWLCYWASSWKKISIEFLVVHWTIVGKGTI